MSIENAACRLRRTLHDVGARARYEDPEHLAAVRENKTKTNVLTVL